MNPWSPLDIGWLAGLIDGEGCIGINKVKGRGYPLVTVSMTDEDVIRRLHAITGFGIVEQQKVRSDNWGKKPLWRWRVNNRRDVVRLLLAIYPMMSLRRQARIAEAAESIRSNVRAKRSNSPVCCPSGHPYDSENTYWYLGRHRQCRTCQRRRQQEYRMRVQSDEAKPAEAPISGV